MMSKEVLKLLQEFKEELRQEWKGMKEIFERSIRSEERGLRTDMEDIKKSLSFIGKGFDDANLRLERTLNENKGLRKENEALQCKVFNLERELADCKAGLLKSEQYTRNRNIEIKGAEYEQNEELKDVLKKMGDAIGEPISSDDIDVCHRVPTKVENKTNIIVQFQRREKRDKVLEMSRKKRLTNAMLGLPTGSPVYVNEHLCPEMKRILGMAIARKREHNWKFVWTKNGIVLARRLETSPTVQILCDSDVNKINSSTTT